MLGVPEVSDWDLAAPAIANPGASGTAVCLDTTFQTATLQQRKARMNIRAVTVSGFADVPITLFVAFLTPGSVSWDVYNGNPTGSGEPIPANTIFSVTNYCIGEDTKAWIGTTTAPSAWRITVRLWTVMPVGIL